MQSIFELPRVAVLLATYNRARYLPEQMDSIMAQESCAVDDSVSDVQSNDGTWEWLWKDSLANDWLRLMPSIARVGSAAENFYRLFRDVNRVEYDFVALADQDAIRFIDKLSRSIDSLRVRAVAGMSNNVMAFCDGRSPSADPIGLRALCHRFLRGRSGWYREQVLHIAELIARKPQFTSQCASALNKRSITCSDIVL